MTSVVPMPAGVGELPAEVLSISSDVSNSVVNPQELQKAIQRAGRALVDVLSSVSISSESRIALKHMAESGKVLEMRCVEEIKNSRVLAGYAELQSDPAAVKQLAELREATAACATASLASVPVVELLSLWSVVHEAVSNVITEEAAALAAQATKAAPEVLEAVEDATDNAMAIGKLLTAALASSSVLVSSVSYQLREAVQHLAEEGVSIADHLAEELGRQLGVIRQVLSAQEWAELRSRCSQSIATEWRALGEAAEKISYQALDGVAQVKLAASEVFDSRFAKAIVAQGFAGLDGVLGQSRDAVDAALDVVRDGGAAAVGAVAACLARSGLPPLLRVEIARDFAQTVGLFFTGLYDPVLDFFERNHVVSALNKFLSGLRGAYDVMAINVLALVEQASQNQALITDIALAVLLSAIGVVYVSYLWFVFSGRSLHSRADEVRQGHEANTWAALATKQKMRVKMFTLVTTACLTVYLPLTRLCLDVVVAGATNRSISDDTSQATSASDLVLSRFRHDAAWKGIVAAAYILLLTFTLPLPLLLVIAIAENRPTGSLENPLITHDLDGEVVPFDDKVYARLITRDPSQLRCPYRSLYAGFEQRWSYYKVLQLLVKLVLVLVIVLAASQDARICGLVSCAIYATVVAISSYSTPFSDPLNNVMEISGKVAALTTCVGGALASFVDMQQTKSRLLELVGVVVSIVHISNLFVMLAVLLLGMRGARLFLKNLLGWITFSDTSRGLEDAPAKNVLPLWDVDKEVKHRVWQAFWRSLALEMAQNAGNLKANPEEITVAHRLEALEQAVVASGGHRVRSHWRGEENAYTSKLRQATRAALEGVDVFWDDASGARDGHLDSKSCFGKMYVLPYPFHCVVVYDDSKDEAIVRDDAEPHEQSKLAKLLLLNFTPIVVAKRALRQKLRVLSSHATRIDFPFQRQEKATVEDGTVTKTDSQGNMHTETRYTTVEFTCYYHWGIIHVATKGDASKRIMAEGFDVNMTYKDGYGDAVAPHTGKVHHLKDRVAVMGPEHLGLTPAMEDSEQLRIIFEQTRGVWERGVLELRAEHQTYRRALERKHLEANATLSDAFWYFVYNNPHLPRQELEFHLIRREGNPQLKSLVETHQRALDSLYLRMKFVQSHPAVAFWFVFWDDVHARNGEMKRLRKLKDDFDPRQRTAICYHVKRRHDLEAWLRERKLLNKRRLFHPRLLDLLYVEMEKRLETQGP
ncbi:hypothetical protein PR003_g25752 [Phytophthora rubi]|uniref:Uncharacterized protein n=1 Tax=Phytophthora rubi TaxID=129364 RepID=A0A6A3IGS8_9STRA|nr:hypothetical protein PR002_g24824 [Phytophthora rubi]KAE8979725.1 hypothetical protein PR001_g24469 [Phytophthora rubi]KAE9288646.1 hypothetical protein PR003_g25752 [Phytophthora rubi]